MEIIEDSKTEYIFKVTKCMFYSLFEKLGVPELTSTMCSVDNAIFNFYLPNSIVFSRTIGNTIFASSNGFWGQHSATLSPALFGGYMVNLPVLQTTLGVSPHGKAQQKL